MNWNKAVDLSVGKIASRCSPFYNVVWDDLDRPITRQEILDADSLSDGPRKQHASKILHFVRHGWTDPIQIDVGIPSLRCNPYWIQDGNHRFAAAIVLGLNTIHATCSGSIRELERLLPSKNHYLTLDEVPDTIIQAYKDGRYFMPPPPVPTCRWGTLAWINYILANGSFTLD